MARFYEHIAILMVVLHLQKHASTLIGASIVFGFQYYIYSLN